MKFLFNMFILISIIIMLFLLFQSLTEKLLLKKEKMINFECGFNSMNNNKIPFSTNFFMLTIIFLMFDLEFSIIFPIVIMQNSLVIQLNIINMFFIYLSMAFLMEWYYGMMEWSK